MQEYHTDDAREVLDYWTCKHKSLFRTGWSVASRANVFLLLACELQLPKLFGCCQCSWLSALQVFFHQCHDDTYLSSGCRSCWDDLAVPQGRQLFHALLNPNVANYTITPALKEAFFYYFKSDLLPVCPSKDHRFLLGWYQKDNPMRLSVK